jgi:hypothetical protein
MFNEKVYEQMHTSKVFKSQLPKFVKRSTLPLHELLEKCEYKLASAAQPHHTETKTAKVKDARIVDNTKRQYFASIFNDGRKASLQQYVSSSYGPSACLTDFMFKINGSFKTFDEGLISYISGLPGTTAATLCNGGISFFEFLKQRAKRVDLAYDDHLNESKR